MVEERQSCRLKTWPYMKHAWRVIAHYSSLLPPFMVNTSLKTSSSTPAVWGAIRRKFIGSSSVLIQSSSWKTTESKLNFLMLCVSSQGTCYKIIILICKCMEERNISNNHSMLQKNLSHPYFFVFRIKWTQALQSKLTPCSDASMCETCLKMVPKIRFQNS